MIATEPLSERLECPHHTRQGFDYWQQLEDNRIVLGGFRDFSILTEMTDDETTTAPIQEALDAFLVELLDTPPRVTHRWAGIFGLTQDLLPLMGRVPGRGGVWVSAGYPGHGNVRGLMCGELVAAAILGGDDRCSSCSRPLGCYSSIRARSSSAARSIAASATARS